MFGVAVFGIRTRKTAFAVENFKLRDQIFEAEDPFPVLVGLGVRFEFEFEIELYADSEL